MSDYFCAAGLHRRYMMAEGPCPHCCNHAHRRFSGYVTLVKICPQAASCDVHRERYQAEKEVCVMCKHVRYFVRGWDTTEEVFGVEV